MVNGRDAAWEKGLSLYGAGPVGRNAGVLLSLDTIDRDGVLDPEEAGVDEIEARQSLNGLASLFYRPDDQHEIELFLTASDDLRRARQGSSPTREVDALRYSTGIRHDFSGEAWGSRIDIYRSRSESQSPHLDQDERHTDDVVDLNASWNWSEGQTLTLGADFRREHFWRLRRGTLEHDATVEHRGALLQQRSTLLDNRLIITLGSRFDEHTQYSGEISPRAGLVYALSEATRIKADYGKGFAAPDIRRSAANYDFTFATLPLRLLGNPDLQPERSKSFSVSLEHESDRFQTSITLFHNDISDLIDLRCIEYCPPGAIPAGEKELRIYDNVDAAITRGVELAFGLQFSSAAGVQANYSYLDTENEQTGQALENRPRERFNLALTVRPWRAGEWNVRGEYTGPQLRGSTWTRSYTLFHLGLSQQLSPALRAQAGINNLSDQRLSDIDENYSNEIRGRYTYLTLSWEF